MVRLNDEFRYWDNKMYESFGDRIPLRQIPSHVSDDEIFSAVKRSVESKRNLIPEIFGYGIDSNRVY